MGERMSGTKHNEGKRMHIYFAADQRWAYDRLARLCPPGVPLATYARSILISHATRVVAAPQQPATPREQPKPGQVPEQEPESPGGFLAGLGGMLVDDDQTATEEEDHHG